MQLLSYDFGTNNLYNIKKCLEKQTFIRDCLLVLELIMTGFNSLVDYDTGSQVRIQVFFRGEGGKIL